MAVTAPKARKFKRAASANAPDRLTQRISLVVTDAEWDRICNWGESDPAGRSLNAQLRAVIMAAVDNGIRDGVASAAGSNAEATLPPSPPQAPAPKDDAARVRAARDFKKQLAHLLTPEQFERYGRLTPHEKRPWNAAAREALATGNPLPEVP